MKERANYNDGFDLYKSLFALLIVAIHTVMFNKIKWISFMAFPLLRLAVPIFFLFSGYFFFKHARKLSTKEQLSLLKHSVIRDLQLYAFWFIVLWPVTLADRQYFIHGIANGLYYILINFLLGSTFIASWYIMALVIGIPIIYFSSRLFSNQLIFSVACLIHLWCALLANWGNSPVGKILWEGLRATGIPITPYMSFPVSLIWLILGKMFADGDLNWLLKKRSLIYTFLGLVGLYIEQYIVTSHQYSVANDNFIMLVPVAVPLFGYLLTTHISLPNAKWLRPFSTILYCMHASLALVIKYFLGLQSITITRFSQSLFLWAATIFLSWTITMVILKVEKLPKMHWLRFSH